MCSSTSFSSLSMFPIAFASSFFKKRNRIAPLVVRSIWTRFCARGIRVSWLSRQERSRGVAYLAQERVYGILSRGVDGESRLSEEFLLADLLRARSSPGQLPHVQKGQRRVQGGLTPFGARSPTWMSLRSSGESFLLAPAPAPVLAEVLAFGGMAVSLVGVAQPRSRREAGERLGLKVVGDQQTILGFSPPSLPTLTGWSRAENGTTSRTAHLDPHPHPRPLPFRPRPRRSPLRTPLPPRPRRWERHALGWRGTATFLDEQGRERSYAGPSSSSSFLLSCGFCSLPTRNSVPVSSQQRQR